VAIASILASMIATTMSCAGLDRNSLKAICRQVIIVAHREDTSSLSAALRRQGFEVAEVRGPYSAQQQRWSSAMRCLVNHAHAWKTAANKSESVIVVEADFVPVRNFGDLPVPAPTSKFRNCLPYLYACGPEIWDLDGPVARGHAGATVAMVIWPEIAKLLLEFFHEQVRSNPEGLYCPWDTQLGYWLKKRGIQSYLPYRHYGEHGGIGNFEHGGAGLGRSHRADALQDSLEFLPAYARGSQLKFLSVRVQARLWGWLRLMAGRLLAWRDFARSDRTGMLRFALGRLLCRSEPKPRP
jgi:hypothetical protein